MLLKEYQQRALTEIRSYLEHLSVWRKKADENPELEIDFPSKAWEKAQVKRSFIPARNGLGQPLPSFCLKIPTGGGKTLLAVKTIDLVNMIYLNRRAGLVLWIVPTSQIYRQTIQNLKDRDHPYRQHLVLPVAGIPSLLKKPTVFHPKTFKKTLLS